tara:strand:- start:41 stop:379 length:339 start_codon:yes stop_codon:yes gene_type:complete
MKLKKSALFVFPLFLLSSCGGNSIIMKTTRGGEILFKKEDTSCVYSKGLGITECRVNGVRTDITGRVFPFTQEEWCIRHVNLKSYDDPNGKEINKDTFACSVSKEFGLFKKL